MIGVTVADATITANYYSHQESPLGWGDTVSTTGPTVTLKQSNGTTDADGSQSSTSWDFYREIRKGNVVNITGRYNTTISSNTNGNYLRFTPYNLGLDSFLAGFCFNGANNVMSSIQFLSGGVGLIMLYTLSAGTYPNGAQTVHFNITYMT